MSHKKFNKMARNKMTKEFSISTRLRLQDCAVVHTETEVRTKKVFVWIKEEPQSLWIATREQGVRLVRNAHLELKKAMAVKHPEVVKENAERKLRILHRVPVARRLRLVNVRLQ